MNSSVRGRREARDLLARVPVGARLKPDGLVAVWVTNKAAVMDLLLSAPSSSSCPGGGGSVHGNGKGGGGGLLSEWGLEPLAEWV